MTDDYSSQEVSPIQLRQELYRAHGGRADGERVEAIIEECKSGEGNLAPEDHNSEQPMPMKTRRKLMAAMRERDECSCGAKVPKGTLPEHILEEHGE